MSQNDLNVIFKTILIKSAMNYNSCTNKRLLNKISVLNVCLADNLPKLGGFFLDTGSFFKSMYIW